jgi:hypothetical protein
VGISGHQPVRIAAGLVGFAFGAWLAFKFWPAVRIVANQWSWPLQDWRVDTKGDERNEWKRWTAEVPDEVH